MTTIATDGIIIACDTQDTLDFKHFPGTKLFPLKDGRIAGITGEWGYCLAMMEYLNGDIEREDAIFDKDEDVDSALLIVGRGPKVWLMNSYDARPYECGFPFATGSGGSIAMGAMMAGADARKAIEIAISLDIYTGGTVKTMKIPT